MSEPASIELLRPPQLSDRAPYAYAAVIGPGSTLVFTAGACPLDAQGAIVAHGDIPAQAEQVMLNLRTALEAAGGGLHRVVKTTVYVATTTRDDLLAAWEVVRRHFGDYDPPSTLVGVTVLGYSDQLVEVEAVAALP